MKKSIELGENKYRNSRIETKLEWSRFCFVRTRVSIRTIEIIKLASVCDKAMRKKYIACLFLLSVMPAKIEKLIINKSKVPYLPKTIVTPGKSASTHSNGLYESLPCRCTSNRINLRISNKNIV
jgi:hypothetical protein